MRTRPGSSTSCRPSTGSRTSPPSVTEPGHPTMPAALPEAPPEVGTPLAPVVPGSAGVPRGRLADHVFRRLADDIVLGHLPPGQHLDEQAMAARYQVSRTPVREALKQLVATGLADYRPNRGSMVRRLDAAELDLMFEAIAELESACARHAALRMTEPQRQALVEAHAQGRRAMQQHDMEAYDLANLRLHQGVLDGAHNPYLIEATRALRSRVKPFRRGRSPGSIAWCSRTRSTAAWSKPSWRTTRWPPTAKCGPTCRRRARPPDCWRRSGAILRQRHEALPAA